MAGVQKVILSCLVVALFLSLTLTEAKEILVGGKSEAWKVPSSPSDSLNKWAEASRFRVGDYLVWSYDSEKDSVLQVTKDSYLTCNTTSPISEYKNGNNTKVELNKPGPFYFISGAKGHCEKGQKVVVVVMTPRHRFVSISPAPSPSEFAVAPQPTSGSGGLKGSLLFGLVCGLGLVWM